MGEEVLQGNPDVAQATALWLRTVTESRFYYSQSRSQVMNDGQDSFFEQI